jgi:hypothetical protein
MAARTAPVAGLIVSKWPPETSVISPPMKDRVSNRRAAAFSCQVEVLIAVSARVSARSVTRLPHGRSGLDRGLTPDRTGAETFSKSLGRYSFPLVRPKRAAEPQ